tara:strand:- start:5 stop:613 length:609 start_codon:yes stop_codon:yes gene_type:complete
MKKLLLFLTLLVLAISTKAQSSEQEIKFKDYEMGKYSKMKISFGGIYEKLWTFKTGKQMIRFTPEDLLKTAKVFEDAINKVIKWNKIADENKVDKLLKTLPFSFNTTRGVLWDSGYESVGSQKAEFVYERFIDSEKITHSYMTTRVTQYGEYNVRSASFAFPSVDTNDKKKLDIFYNFLDFIKNNKNIIKEKLSKTKVDLFK